VLAPPRVVANLADAARVTARATTAAPLGIVTHEAVRLVEGDGPRHLLGRVEDQSLRPARATPADRRLEEALAEP